MLRPAINFRDLTHNPLFCLHPDSRNRPGSVIFEAAFLKFDSEILQFLKND